MPFFYVIFHLCTTAVRADHLAYTNNSSNSDKKRTCSLEQGDIIQKILRIYLQNSESTSDLLDQLAGSVLPQVLSMYRFCFYLFLLYSLQAIEQSTGDLICTSLSGSHWYRMVLVCSNGQLNPVINLISCTLIVQLSLDMTSCFKFTNCAIS